MTVDLYQNQSESNIVDKSINLIASTTGSLRDGSSITDPTILLELGANDISGINYIYIQEWHRYYYVTGISSVMTNLWSLTCHVDVLMTYRGNLRSLSAIIARQENVYNLYLDDDKFLVNAQRMYWTKAFPNRVTPANSGQGSSFILTLAGGESQSS